VFAAGYSGLIWCVKFNKLAHPQTKRADGCAENGLERLWASAEGQPGAKDAGWAGRAAEAGVGSQGAPSRVGLSGLSLWSSPHSLAVWLLFGEGECSLR